MKKSTVRIFAMVLAALMVLSLLPLAYAHAEEVEIPDGLEIPGFTWMGDHYQETEHRYGEVVNEDYIVDGGEGDCLNPTLYWKSCINVNPYTQERCGVTAEAAYNTAINNLLNEMKMRAGSGEKESELKAIAADAVAAIEEKYKFYAGGNGHTWVEVEYQPATCEQAGWETYHRCEVCGEVGGYIELPATGHRFVDGVCEICGVADPDYVPEEPAPVDTADLAGDEQGEVPETEDANVEETNSVTEENTNETPSENVEAAEAVVAAPEQTPEEQPNDEPKTEGEETPAAEEPKTEGEETPAAEESKTEGEETPAAEEPKTEGEETPTAEKPKTEGEETPAAEEPKAEGEETPAAEEPNTEGEETPEEQPNDVEVYTGEVTVAQTAASEDVVDSFTNAAWDYLGLTNENTVSVQNVTPYKEDGTELSDEEIPEEGIDFEMDIPEGFDPENQDLEVYHRNKDGVWEKMQIVEINIEENKIVVRKVRSFSPFALVVKRLDDQIAFVARDNTTFNAPEGSITITFNANGGTLSGSTKRSTDAAGKITLPDATECTKTDCTLLGWKSDSETYAPGAEATFTEDTTLTAEWTKLITFKANGGTLTGSTKRETDADGKITLPNATECTITDRTLMGWKSDSETYAPGAEATFTEDTELTAEWTKLITFNANGGTLSDSVANPGKTDTDGKITLPSAAQCTKTGYTLVSWTKVGGSYLPGKEYTFTEDTELTAKWAKNVKIIFDPNAITAEGSMPPQDKDADGNPLYEGQYVQLNANQFVNGDEEFTGWNTDKNAASTGKAYDDKAEVKLGDTDLTLYAQWTHTHTVTFKPNTEEGGTGTEQTQAIREKTTQKLKTLEELEFTSTTAEFINWKDQDGKTYTNGQSISPTKDLVLTAQWDKKYTVTFKGSGGTRTTEEGAESDTATQTILESDFTKAGKTGVALDPNPFTREGYVFTGWSKNDNDNTPTIEDGDTVKKDDFSDAKLPLYACWADKVTITYNGNGANGTIGESTTTPGRKSINPDGKMNPESVPKGSNVTLTENSYVKANGLFYKWNTSADEKGTPYQNKASITNIQKNLDLYAIWNGPLSVTGNKSSSDDYAVIGETLTAKLPKTDDTAVTYKWYRDAVFSTNSDGVILGITQGTEIGTGTTYQPTFADAGSKIVCVAIKENVRIASNEKKVESVKWMWDIINDGNTSAYPYNSFYTQSGAIGGVVNGMKYKLNGTWHTVTTAKDGVMYVTEPGTYLFNSIESETDAIEVKVYAWYTVGFYYSGTTSTSSSGSTVSASGRATMTRVTSTSSSGAMPSTPLLASATDTQRESNDIMKLSSSVDNVWVVKRGSTTRVNLTVTPSSGSYAHISLNGSSYASFGNARTTSTTSSSTTNASRTYSTNPDKNGNWIRMPMMWSIIFSGSATSPRTADESNLGLWSALCFASLTGVAVILTETCKRRKSAK